MTDRARTRVFKPADFIVDNIYLGGEGSTVDADWLRSQKIGRVLTVACHMDALKKHEGVQYLAIDVDDDPNEDLRTHWAAAFAFIRADRSSNVLVHCVSGISHLAQRRPRRRSGSAPGG